MRVWTVTTGEAGMVAQAEGLAEAVGEPFEARTVRLRAPWSAAPAHMAPGLLRYGLTAPLAPPWPDLLISCGRRGAAVSVAVRRASGGATFTAHVQDPRAPLRRFDLVIAPRHDGLEGPNALATRGALHRIARAGLDAAAERWRTRLGELQAAALVGGAVRGRGFSSRAVAALADGLARLDGPVAVTPSRRTDPRALAMLRARLPDARFPDGEGDNPYLGMLALARHIVVTEDSVSMTSEAAATGKPVHIAAMGGVGRRVARFHALLRAEGVTRPFDGALACWTCDPVDDAPRAAAEVRRRMSERRRRSPEGQRYSTDTIS